jgi:hypothetical protein
VRSARRVGPARAVRRAAAACAIAHRARRDVRVSPEFIGMNCP